MQSNSVYLTQLNLFFPHKHKVSCLDLDYHKNGQNRDQFQTGNFKLMDVVTKWNHIMSDSLLRSYGGNTFCPSGQRFSKGINGSVLVMRMLVVSIITPFIRGFHTFSTITAVDLPKMPSEVGVMTSIAPYSMSKTQRYFFVALILIREKNGDEVGKSFEYFSRFFPNHTLQRASEFFFH